MPIRHHAQRKHIIHSLDTLLYQLHTLSFFLAPSILAYLCRCGTQFQFSKPRELDKRRALSFWFFLVIFVNIGSVWSHATSGAPEGRTILLDFVGMGRRPSKTELLWLDFTIIFLEIILSTIAFETSLTNAMPDDTPDPLYIPPITETIFDSEENEPMLPTSTTDADPSSLTSDPAFSYPPKQRANDADHLPPREPVLNLTISHIYHRLVTPTPIPPTRPLDLDNLENALRRFSLPLPATSGASRAVSRALDIIRLHRERELERSARGEEGRGGTTGPRNNPTQSEGPSNSRRIPGAINNVDDDD